MHALKVHICEIEANSTVIKIKILFFKKKFPKICCHEFYRVKYIFNIEAHLCVFGH